VSAAGGRAHLWPYTLGRLHNQKTRLPPIPQEKKCLPVRNQSDPASASAAHRDDAGNFARRSSCELTAPKRFFLCMDLSQRILAQRRRRQCSFPRVNKDL